MATTPPPLTVTEPPPTPLHGSRYDAGSAGGTRMQARRPGARARNAARTPSPPGNYNSSDSPSPGLRRSARLRSSYVHSPPSSPLSPSRARDQQGAGGSRLHKHAAGPAAGANSPAGDSKKKGKGLLEPHASSLLLSASSMLPTPAKTPRKKDTATKKSPSVTRILFPHGPQPAEEEAMPKPHRKGGRGKGLSLESFAHSSESGDIEIFTDTRDKVPEVDISADNPFYSPGRSGSKRKRKVDRSGGTDPAIQQALDEDQGMVYVFRGQRRYRAFREIDEHTPEDGPAAASGLDLDEFSEVRPFTRSSVKPRVLFPRAAAEDEPAGNTTDEEADTDIDEASTLAAAAASTPTKAGSSAAAGDSPITPPTTVRTKKRTVEYELGPAEGDAVDDSLFTIKKARRSVHPGAGAGGSSSSTPFAGWKRTKSAGGADRIGTLKGKKRAGEALERDDEAKRTRGEASASF